MSKVKEVMTEVLTNPQVNKEPTVGSAPGGKNVVVVAIVVLVILIVLVVVWFSIKSLSPSTTTTTPPTVSQGETVPEIKSDADFQKLEDQLNKTDIESMSAELDKNDADSAEF